ncbi:MAG: hypothetical protein H6597_01020 [Flavobacteriales bacterium]|nr:hypothetical protein [Flavobacteriales bacterium]MCB9193087.1 hypothetical protein [Flavobacteriales bacterium]
MNTRMLLACLAAGVASFLIGWLVWGMLLADTYAAGMNHFEGYDRPQDQMNMLAMVLGNLGWGAITGYALWRMGVKSAMAGMVPGAIIAALTAFSMDMMFLGMTHMFASHTIIIIDVVVNLVVGGILGAVAGWVLGMGGGKAPA